LFSRSLGLFSDTAAAAAAAAAAVVDMDCQYAYRHAAALKHYVKVYIVINCTIL